MSTLKNTTPVIFDDKHVEYLAEATRVRCDRGDRSYALSEFGRDPRWPLDLLDGRHIQIESWQDEAVRLRKRQEHALVGVAAIVKRLSDGAVLLGKRKGSHGAGTWGLPGGHLDVADGSVREAVAREVFEETGLRVTRVHMLSKHTFTHFPEIQQACLTLYAIVRVESDTEPEIREPDKCEEWRWVEEGDPWPGPLFAPLSNLIDGLGVDLWGKL